MNSLTNDRPILSPEVSPPGRIGSLTMLLSPPATESKAFVAKALAVCVPALSPDEAM